MVMGIILFDRAQKIKSSLPGEAWLGEKKNGTLGLFDPSNTQELVGKRCSTSVEGSHRC